MNHVISFAEQQGSRERMSAMREKLEQEISESGGFACKVVGIVLLISLVAGPFLTLLMMPFNAIGLTDFLAPIIFIGVYLVASLTVIRIFIVLAREKGYFRKGGTGWLWFVGICTTPITVGILVLALPEAKDDQPLVDSVDLPNF